MMRYNIRPVAAFISLLVFGLLSLVSCEREISEPMPSSVLTFVDASQTRSTQEGFFEAGDAIGVFVCAQGGDMPYRRNVKYVYDGKIFRPGSPSDAIMYDGVSPDIYTYFPYRESNNDIRSIRNEVRDQRTEDDWKRSDFLTATHKGRIINGAVPLRFFHRYSTIQLKVVEPDGVKAIRMKDVKYGTGCDLLTGCMTVSGSGKDISLFPYKSVSANELIFRCTLPAGEILSSQSVHLIYPDGSLYKFEFPHALALQEGKIHHLTADMSKGEYSYVFKVGKSDFRIPAHTAASYRTEIDSYRSYRRGGKDLTEPLAYEITGTLPAWITVNKIPGGGLEFRAEENRGNSARRAVIRLRQEVSGKIIEISVDQEAAKTSYDYTFKFGSGHIILVHKTETSLAESKSFTIISTRVPTINGKQGSTEQVTYTGRADVSWIHVNGSTIRVDNNSSKVERTGVVTFTQTGSGKTITVSVIQKKKNDIIIGRS